MIPKIDLLLPATEKAIYDVNYAFELMQQKIISKLAG